MSFWARHGLSPRRAWANAWRRRSRRRRRRHSPVDHDFRSRIVAPTDASSEFVNDVFTRRRLRTSRAAASRRPAPLVGNHQYEGEKAMEKRAIVFHGTGGHPDYCWYRWLGAQLEARGYVVEIPHYPDLNRD